MGGIGSHFAGKIEAEDKEKIANERINQLQEELAIKIEQNGQLVSLKTVKAVEDSTQAKIKADSLREIAKKRDEKQRSKPTPQQRALGSKT